jgi:hypothetical protein
VWKDYPLVLVLEYVPVIAFLLFDLLKKRSTQFGSTTQAGPGNKEGGQVTTGS